MSTIIMVCYFIFSAVLIPSKIGQIVDRLVKSNLDCVGSSFFFSKSSEFFFDFLINNFSRLDPAFQL